jgi:hypothetical protein
MTSVSVPGLSSKQMGWYDFFPCLPQVLTFSSEVNTSTAVFQASDSPCLDLGQILLGKWLMDLTTLLSYLCQGARMSLVKVLFFCVSVFLRNTFFCLKGDPRIAILFYFSLGSKRLVCPTSSRRHGDHTEAAKISADIYASPTTTTCVCSSSLIMARAYPYSSAVSKTLTSFITHKLTLLLRFHWTIDWNHTLWVDQIVATGLRRILELQSHYLRRYESRLVHRYWDDH